MAKISEVITIYSGMSKTVNLRYEFAQAEENRKRMQGYKPIKSHREIFLRLARSFLPNEHKVHLLVGHYGTGKSHLLLMLANYFSQTLQMPELTTFFENFSRVDEGMSKQIQHLRGDGRYLVVIPDYDSKEDFSETLLIALETAFQREGVEEELDSVYREAGRVVEQWEADETAGKDPLLKFSVFQEMLEQTAAPYNSLTTLKQGLLQYEQAALIHFKEIYQRLIGTSFRYRASNIVAILDDVIHSETFKQRFKGIVFLYDEFDHTLNNRRISIEVVQQFAELCRNSNSIVFIGSLHKDLAAFAHEYSVQDFKTVQQRFHTIDMKSEGLEEIVTAIVHVEKEHLTFQQQIAPQFGQIYAKIPDMTRLNLFNWLSPNEIQEKIIDAVYPLHPLTMACLLRLSTTIGSYNRTLFTFLGGEGADEENDYSYKAFIDRTNILDSSGLLSFYTTDYLVEYFQRELDLNSADLRENLKKPVMAYHSSLKEFRNQDDSLFAGQASDSLYEKILKLMLVFELVGIPNNVTNLTFGLHLQMKDKKLLNNALKLLTQQKVIFLNKTSNVYEFRRGTDIDWDNIIHAERLRLVESSEFDVAQEFLSIYKVPGQDRYLEAKKFNSTRSTDKRLLRVFETVKNFGQPFSPSPDPSHQGRGEESSQSSQGYFDVYEKQLLDTTSWKESYDGVVIYVIAETEDEVREARQIAQQNTSDYVLVVIPEQPLPITEVFLDLKAALTLKHSDEYSSAPIADQARLDESYIGDINKGYAKHYIDIRTKYLGGRLATWYGKGGRILDTSPLNEQEPVYQFLTTLYRKFNVITDDEVNRCHKSLTGNKKFILRDAVNTLLESGQQIEIDTSFGNDKGFIRYLKNVFFNQQVLRKVDQQGTKLSCQIEKDTDKYCTPFPGLADMIAEFQAQEKLNVRQFVARYRSAPYGLGEVSLELFLAFLVKYFGDELSYKAHPNEPGEISIQAFSQIETIVNQPKAFAQFEKRRLDETQQAFLRELYQQFSQTPLTVGTTPRLKDVVVSLKQWFEHLPTLTRSETFYDDPQIHRFLQLMKSIDTAGAFQFLFHRLQTVWDYEEDERFDGTVKQAILEGLAVFREQLDLRLEQAEHAIFEGFLELFNVEGNTFDDVATAIQHWYNALNANQLDVTANWQTPYSKALLNTLKDTQHLRDVLYADLPGSHNIGLGKLADWNTDNTTLYLNKVKEGLETLKDHEKVVDMPEVEVEHGECQNAPRESKSTIRYENEQDLRILLKIPQNAKAVWYSYQGDPTDAKVQKEKITSDTPLPVIKEGHKTVKLVAVDEEGNFSQVYTLELQEKTWLDSSDAYEWTIPTPKNRHDVNAIFRELANTLVQTQKVSKTELAEVLKRLLQEYE